MRAEPKERVGIRDVADAANVSVTTVSHALNGKGRISETTRGRVVALAAELGYRPSSTARNLVSGSTGLLGITVSASPDVPFGITDFDYFMQLLNAATAAALERGRALIVTGPTGVQGEAFDQIDLDGAIVVDPIADDPLLTSLRSRGLPVVTTGKPPAGEGDGWIDNDHVAATESILDHLSAQGAERIALLTSPPIISYTSDIVFGYEAWCARNGQEPLLSTAHGVLGEGGGFVAATELLDRERPPDAIYATIDRLGLGALLAAKARQIEVPEQLMVACCTDSTACAWAEPPMTAVALNPEEIGRRAVEALTEMIDGRRPDASRRIVPTGILRRRSTRRSPS